MSCGGMQATRVPGRVSSMAADLIEALEALDLAVARAAGVVGDEVVQPYAAVALNARRRIGFLGETVVIALGGGTGVGKSSLLNALAGTTVARTGALRPTTNTPLAWIPDNPEPGLVRLLDDLGIADRIGQSTHPNVAVFDLPDFDSVVGEHRATVERLLPRVDAVLWVVDPEKYNDRTIHADYLRPLAGYQGQFVFALNQVDRLAEGELATASARRDQAAGRFSAGSRPTRFLSVRPRPVGAVSRREARCKTGRNRQTDAGPSPGRSGLDRGNRDHPWCRARV
jgi:energy-coupling factor transporter ATP-binding protein EcfA2